MIEFFVRHKVAGNVLMLIMLLIGFYGAKKLNSQFLPHFDLNLITVSVTWPNANATDIEHSVLIPLQRELRNLSSVKKISGLARNGLARIVIEFKEKTDMTLALSQTETRVAQANNLPAQAQPPVVSQIERFEPVARILLYGDSDFESLKAKAYQYESELLKKGINKIQITGIPDEHISIKISTTSLLALNLSLHEVGRLIESKNPEAPVGEIGNQTDAREIRVPRAAQTLADYSQMIIRTSKAGERVRLSDIAVLTQKPKDNSTQLFYEGQPAIELLLQRTENGSAFYAAEKLQEWQQSKQQLQNSKVKFLIFDERWLLIKERLTLLIKNGVTGLIMIMTILFLFLNVRVAFWTAVGIPISIMATLGILYLIGGTIDMVTMFALIMTLGIIVDDTIVVSEYAYAQYTHGHSPSESVIESVYKMFKPVLASSLTTIAAFLPLIVISGIIGQILSVIPITVISVIIASLVECFFILPTHLRHSFEKMKDINIPAWRQKFEQTFERIRDIFCNIIMKSCVKYTYIPMVTAIGIFIFSFTLIISQHVAFTFFPSPDGNRLTLNTHFKSGTKQAAVFDYLRYAEQKLHQLNYEYETKYNVPFLKVTTINTGSTADTQGDSSNKFGEQYGHITVELVGADKREITNQTVIKNWKDALLRPQNLETLEITAPRGGPPGRDIDLKLSGNKIDILKTAAIEIKDKLSDLDGVNNISDNVPFGKEQLQLFPKPEMHLTGLSLGDISQQLQAGFSDYIVQRINKEREELDVTISLADDDITNNDILNYFPIKANKTMIPLSSLVTIQTASGFDEIRHSGGTPSIQITAEVDSTVNNANFILLELGKEFLPNIKQKYQIDIGYEGRSEEQSETLNDMIFGAMLAFLLIYLLLVLIFASYTWPFVIIIILPLTLSGALIGHWILGYDLTILSLFGIFGLCGIVANDAIILLTFYLDTKSSDHDFYHRLHNTIKQRFRPVFLTSITTIAGLSPLLFERSLQAQFLIPMAISITFGMALALPLVLCLLPALIKAHEKIIRFIKHKQLAN